MKGKLTRDDLLNWWLTKYHNTSVSEVIAKHPKEILDSPDWFKLYPVTQEQHDEWYDWAVRAVAKDKRLSLTYIRKHFSLIYLDCSPYVKQESE